LEDSINKTSHIPLFGLTRPVSPAGVIRGEAPLTRALLAGNAAERLVGEGAAGTRGSPLLG